jgi:hypothetical protein
MYQGFHDRPTVSVSHAKPLAEAPGTSRSGSGVNVEVVPREAASSRGRFGESVGTSMEIRRDPVLQRRRPGLESCSPSVDEVRIALCIRGFDMDNHSTRR